MFISSQSQPKVSVINLSINPNIIPIETLINGSSVLGTYVAMNSYGMIVPNAIREEELNLIQSSLPQDYKITGIDSDDNTFGNLILCNDKGAVISPLLIDAQEIIEKTLNVPAKVFNFAKSKLPGACGLVNNKGVVVHPMTTDEEPEIISSNSNFRLMLAPLTVEIHFYAAGRL